MEPSVVAILGIPVDDYSLDETVETILKMVQAYAIDGRPRQVATVNVDFMVNALSWKKKRSRHPELLHILRHADLVTADGMPIVWASRLLGTPLKERVAGSDLVPALARAAAGREKSVYFLGGSRDLARQAAEVLVRRHPGLVVAGTGAPLVEIEGESLMEAEASDAEIVESINGSGADILLIGFGNPKQELWFHRNRYRLKVPVSIGVGGTFAFITGDVARAPAWMQHNGLEWIFRIVQDPKRLWKRYFIGFFKFSVLLLPVLVYARYHKAKYNLVNRLFRGWLPGEAYQDKPGPAGGIERIRMPGRLDGAYANPAARDMMARVSRARHVILDFSDTRFMDSSGLGLLIRIFKKRHETGNARPYLLGLNRNLIHMLKVSRIWDMVHTHAYDHINDIWSAIRAGSKTVPLELVIGHGPGEAYLYLVGRLDAAAMAGVDTKRLFESLSGRNCLVDLEATEFVDSGGLGFFLKLQKLVNSHGKALVLYHVPAPVRQLFRITRLEALFLVEPDAASARKRIEALS